MIRRYIYRLIDAHDSLNVVKKKKTAPQVLTERYAQMRTRLSHAGWISEGYAQDRGPGAGGPCYQWTRKVKGKTVSVALSRDQYIWLSSAINEWREIQAALKEMKLLSRKFMFDTIPGPARRKRLSKKTLGTM